MPPTMCLMFVLLENELKKMVLVFFLEWEAIEIRMIQMEES